MPAQTIDEVLDQLDRVIARAQAAKSRLGYFPALYRKVTLRIKQGIAAGEFEDGPRMETLDVIFANRYLEAVDGFEARTADRRAPWMASFAIAERWSPLVLQHLMLGMNVHINFDLGIAAAQTAPGSELASLRADFNRINAILSSLVDQVKAELAQIWRPLAILDRLSGRIEDVVVDFSMGKARDFAWSFAEQIAAAEPEARAKLISTRAAWTAQFGQVIWSPAMTLRLGLLLIRLGERRSVAENIEILR